MKLRFHFTLALAFVTAIISSASAQEIRKDSIPNYAPVVYPDSLDVSDLDELVVVSEKPLVSKEIDRIAYDVQADDESKTARLNEILRKVPLVSVEEDGTIKVKGSSSFKIYKNGRPNNSFTKNAKDIFKALPASMIKRIEVITDPGAREDAEGTSAILNIVTMENTVIKGIMGSVGIDWSQYGDIPNPDIWLNTQLGKFNFSGYAGINHTPRKSRRSISESFYRYDDSGNELSSKSEGIGGGNSCWFGTEASLELDTLNLFTAEFGGYFYNWRSESLGNVTMLANDGSLIYSYRNRSSSSPYGYADYNGSVNYQRSTRLKGETITLSYLVSTTDETQNSRSVYEDAIHLPVPYSGTVNDYKLNFLENTIQADWTRPLFKGHKFDVGSKYINRRNHSRNDQEYIGYRNDHSDFIHVTQVLAFYADYRLKAGKFGARAGLRYEWSHMSARYRDKSQDPFSSDFSDWVPNASVSFDADDHNTLKLAYSTRIRRPGISQLNPAVVESPTHISSGNPDLGSSRFHSLSFNYTLMSGKINLDFSSGYDFSSNQVISISEMLPGDILRTSYANAGRNRSVNLGMWFNWNISRKTSLMLNAHASHRYESNPSLGLSSKGWSESFFGRFRQKLPKNFSFTVWANLWKSAPSIYSRSVFSFKDRIYWGITVNKEMLKENRLSLLVSIRNPFCGNWRTYESHPENVGYTGYSRNLSNHNANVFAIGVSYRFGSLNAQVKKTAKSISNDDRESRSSK